MLVCIWGGDRYAWGSPAIVALIAAGLVLAVALVVRERRAADPIVPLDLLRTRVVAVASAALFLATASLFAITVFVPLFLQSTTGREPHRGGPVADPGDARHHGVHELRRPADRAQRPLQALPARRPGASWRRRWARSRCSAAIPRGIATGVAIGVFGLGFGMVGQVLITAVQNGVDRRRLGVAMATTSFFRAIGGAAGAALLGAVFTARIGSQAGVASSVQTVFAVAAPLALLGLAIVLLLPEARLQTSDEFHGSQQSSVEQANERTGNGEDRRIAVRHA